MRREERWAGATLEDAGALEGLWEVGETGVVQRLMLGSVRRLDTPADPVQWERAGLTSERELVRRALNTGWR